MLYLHVISCKLASEIKTIESKQLNSRIELLTVQQQDHRLEVGISRLLSILVLIGQANYKFLASRIVGQNVALQLACSRLCKVICYSTRIELILVKRGLWNNVQSDISLANSLTPEQAKVYQIDKPRALVYIDLALQDNLLL